MATTLGVTPLPVPGGGPAAPARSTPTSVGHYAIERMLGQGASGVVYAARHRVLGKPVAIKLLRDEWIGDETQSQRFLREARIAATLTHENIVNITDFGTDEMSGAPYLVMEYLRGPSLRSVCAMGPLPWSRAVHIAMQLARALACAHADGILHRDLKPHNVLLETVSGRTDLVKLCDFGLSRMRDGADRITSTGAFLGTPAYMAPEQIKGDVQDERCDIYALGVTLFEMLTGRLPYSSTSPVGLIAEIVGEQKTELVFGADVPERLRRLVTQCLARNPADRPRSAADIEIELAAIAELPSEGVVDLVGQTIGNYRVIAPLGSGGAGSVWLAEHPVIGTRFAIKVLRPEAAREPTAFERFVNEARAASAIPSPHIARTIDLGRLPGGQPYAVIEYLDGETLDARINREHRVAPAAVLPIARQIASALVEAHALGIIHRDIKPANVFLVGSDPNVPSVKLLDFGIAKLAGPVATGVQTQIGYFMGTVLYCPPEQLMGIEVTPSADVYALGATMFEMLVGHPPFSGTAADVAVQATSSDAPRLRSVDPSIDNGLDDLVAAMLVREPSRRLKMTEVIARLDAIAARGVSGVARATLDRAPDVVSGLDETVSAELDAALARPRWIPRAVLAAVAVLSIVIVWAIWPSPRVERRATPAAVTPAEDAPTEAVPTERAQAVPAKPVEPAPAPSSTGPTPSTAPTATTTAPVVTPIEPPAPALADEPVPPRREKTDKTKTKTKRAKTDATPPVKAGKGDVIIADPFAESP